jgi:diguanylate cyclase (GGDEF)-like protein
MAGQDDERRHQRGDYCHEEGDDHVPAEQGAEEGRELDVAHAHPGRVDERGHKECAARGKRRERPLDAGIANRLGDEGHGCRRQDDAVGDDAPLQVGHRDGDEDDAAEGRDECLSQVEGEEARGGERNREDRGDRAEVPHARWFYGRRRDSFRTPRTGDVPRRGAWRHIEHEAARREHRVPFPPPLRQAPSKAGLTSRIRLIAGGIGRPLVSAILVAMALGAGVSLAEGYSDRAILAAGAALGVLAAGWTLSLVLTLYSAETLALRDSLTGLPNRVLLDDRISQALRRSRRTRRPFTLVLVDLDGFKEVNDIRGHPAGDAVLKAIGQRLASAVRVGDTVARVGGDEFVVLSLGTRSEDEAAALVGRLRHELRLPYRFEGGTVEIDASIGWALYPDDGSNAEELLARADGQMYATKRDATEPSARRLDAGIVRDFETALDRQELVVHYQPVVHLASGAVSGVEALVRRRHPDRGLLSPAEFVPHLERTPMIRALTLFVAADALRQASAWRARGHDLRASVNVPYRLRDDSELADRLGELLESSGLPPGALTLEVVPSGPAAGAELDPAVLARITGLGVRLALDDLGRASSLAALRVLPLDEVKIDGSFVHGLERNRSDAAVVQSLIELGHALGLEVVAEGVESRAAWRELEAQGCDYVQGFYIAGPAPAREVTRWLEGGWPALAKAS